MCVLMLRGPQTPGELKQRSERMHAFADLAGVHETLERLIERELVARLERRPGHKEERYAQLLQGEDEQPPGREPPVPALNGEPAAPHAPARAAPQAPAATDDLRERVARLEREVAELRAAMRHPVHEHQP